MEALTNNNPTSELPMYLEAYRQRRPSAADAEIDAISTEKTQVLSFEYDFIQREGSL